MTKICRKEPHLRYIDNKRNVGENMFLEDVSKINVFEICHNKRNVTLLWVVLWVGTIGLFGRISWRTCFRFIKDYAGFPL